MDEPHPGLKSEDGKSKGVEGPIPTDDVQRRVTVLESEESVTPLYRKRSYTLVKRAAEIGTAKVPMRIGSVHFELPNSISICGGKREPTPTLDGQPSLLDAGVGHEAMDRALGDANVVPSPEPQISVHGPQSAGAAEDEEQLVAIGVDEVGRVLAVRAQEADDDVRIEKKGVTALEGGAPRRQ
jgi:hypothetical protein